MGSAPRLILFAGVNGAGKSTLYRSGLWMDEDADANMVRVNADEILRARGWDWSNLSAQIAAGKIAVRSIKSLIESKSSFNQETTLAGRLIVRNVKKAAALGYEISVNYVGVASPEIAQGRIENRVSFGGHGIDEADVKRRYSVSADNLVEIFPYCATVKFFDNTQSLQLVAFADQNSIIDFRSYGGEALWYEAILQRLQPLLQ